VGSRLAAPLRFVCDVLSGVPSIVVGILGYELLVVPLGGNNAVAGAAALAFIMIPLVARTTEEMLRLVPGSYREASIALGATKAGTILRVVIPSATGSVVTGIMLAIARIAGETAPLLLLPDPSAVSFAPLQRLRHRSPLLRRPQERRAAPQGGGQVLPAGQQDCARDDPRVRRPVSRGVLDHGFGARAVRAARARSAR